jgi:hypothetical protein
MIAPPSARYNVGMACEDFEDDESLPPNDKQPRECEDQFDDDLMREFDRIRRNSNQQPSHRR